MAESNLIRRILAIFDRDSARKAEAELEASLAKAGAKGGENFLRELKKQFDTKTADLKVALAKGIIDPKEFRRLSDEAAKQFNAGILAGMNEARAAGTLTEREYVKLAKTLKKTGLEGETMFTRLKGAALRFGAAMAAAFSVRAIVNFGKEAVKAAAASEKAWTNLRGSVEAAGVSFAEVEPQLKKAADQFERTTTHDDDDFILTLQRLIALTGDYAKSLENVGLVADVAARFFDGELAPAADLVGRAMAGNLRGLKALGIDAKDTGTALEELAKRSMGAAADAAGSLDGKLKQLNVAWGNFKKAVGFALIEAGGGTGVLDTLTAAIRTMTQFITENQKGLSHLGSVLTWLFVHVIARLQAVVLLPFIAQLAVLAKAYALIASGAVAAAGAMGENTKSMEAHAKKAHELADALARLTIASGKTAIFGLSIPSAPGAAGSSGGAAPPPPPPPPPSSGVEDHLKALEREIDIQKRRAEAIRQGEAAVEALNRELFIEQEILQAGVEIGSAAAAEIRERAGALYDATKVVEMLGKDALTTSNAMDMLRQAFKEGGTAGLLALAKTAVAKVKEHFASVISEGALALGSLARGDFRGAAIHGASAVQHGLALNEWRKLATGAISGGGGGGSARGGAGAGAVGSGAATGLDSAASVEPKGPEIRIYFDPLDPRDPRVQSFVHETNQQVEERYGSNATITWHPRTGS